MTLYYYIVIWYNISKLKLFNIVIKGECNLMSRVNQNDNKNLEVSNKQDLTNREEKVLRIRNAVEEVNDMREKINDLVENIYKKEVEKLDSLLNVIESENEKAYMDSIRIPDNKLEYWVLKLPLLIDEINERSEYRALDVDIAETIKKEKWDEEYLNASNSNDPNIRNYKVQEKKSYANTQTILQEYTHIIKNRIHHKIRTRTESAEKVFYSIKSILGKRL